MGQRRVLHPKPLLQDKLALIRGKSNPPELSQFISIPIVETAADVPARRSSLANTN
jgi:hypothetical protein